MVLLFGDIEADLQQEKLSYQAIKSYSYQFFSVHLSNISVITLSQ